MTNRASGMVATQFKDEIMTVLPFVTIIIPCYNEEKFIGRCLDSLLAGDYPVERMEILVVDGGSKDNTRKIIRDYSERHAGVRLVDNPHRLKSPAISRRFKSGSVTFRS